MIAPLGAPELKLLAYLFEHAGGYHQRLWMDPKAAMRSLGISTQQFATDSACLVAHGYAGVRKFADDAASAAVFPYCAIWLTGKGEDYMRAFKATPARKIAAATMVAQGRGGS